MRERRGSELECGGAELPEQIHAMHKRAAEQQEFGLTRGFDNLQNREEPELSSSFGQLGDRHMAGSSGGFGNGGGKFLGIGTHEMMLQDDGDFEIIIENAAETDDGAFGGESSTCADGEKDLVSFEEQYQNMIKEQLGGLLQEYFAHKQKGIDSPPVVANSRERSGAGCSSTFKTLHKSCLREFEIVKKLNKNKDRKEKREIVLSCPNGAPAEATTDSKPPDAALQSATYNREELHLIRSRTISR